MAGHLLEGRARGRPWTHLSDIVKIVLGEGADGAGRQGRLSPDRREKDLAHGIDGSPLERPALGQVELEPELGDGVAVPQGRDVPEGGEGFPQVLHAVTLPGIGEAGGGVSGYGYVGTVDISAGPMTVIRRAFRRSTAAIRGLVALPPPGLAEPIFIFR
jgi:hypothetical protein